MTDWPFYPVFAASVISVVALTHIAVTNHDTANPRNLSQLAAAEQALLIRFRNILLICGLMFAITVFGFIVPRTAYSGLVALSGVLMIGGELILAILPARDKTRAIHNLMAWVMGAGMLGLALLFAIGLEGAYRWIEATAATLMCLCAALTFLDKPRFIFYELVFIFTSHASIVTAALALR